MQNRYAIARAEAEHHPLFLDLIDTNFHNCGFRYPLEPLLLEAARRLSSPGFRYDPDPAGSVELRREIAAHHGAAGALVDENSVIVTASASESYSHIFASRCRPGDRVLLPSPGYPMFEEVAARHGLKVDFYHQRRDADWQIDVEALESVISPRTAAVVLISPNNPTGSVVSVDTIGTIGDICRQRGLFLVVDEVFSEIVFTGQPLPRPAVLLPDVLVYTISGVSKLFASPELKVSWIAVSGPAHDDGRVVSVEMAVEQLAVQNDLFLSASVLSQEIATGMFRQGRAFTEKMGEEIALRRQMMLEEIQRIDGLEAIAPRGGIHLPIAVDPDLLPSKYDDEEICAGLLESHRLATHPGYLYGIHEPVTLVVSYLAPPQRIREGFARMEAYFSSARS